MIVNPGAATLACKLARHKEKDPDEPVDPKNIWAPGKVWVEHHCEGPKEAREIRSYWWVSIYGARICGWCHPPMARWVVNSEEFRTFPLWVPNPSGVQK